MADMSIKIAAILFIFGACGNIVRPEDDTKVPPTGPSGDPVIDLGTTCADFDINVTCPDAMTVPEPDASQELDDETKAACCHALLDGQPPKFECGYPPGLCKNGKKTLHCGDGAFYELCNP